MSLLWLFEVQLTLEFSMAGLEPAIQDHILDVRHSWLWMGGSSPPMVI